MNLLGLHYIIITPNLTNLSKTNYIHIEQQRRK